MKAHQKLARNLAQARRALLAGAAISSLLLSGCGGGGDDETNTAGTTQAQQLSAEAELGKKLFFDTALSASGQMSCGTCHDPSNGHTQVNARAAQFGGAGHDLQGKRLSMPASYLEKAPAFSVAADGTPIGGMFWHGAVNTLAEQALGPFQNPVEMANAGVLDVLNKVARSSYAEDFKKVYGADAFTKASTDDTFGNPTYFNVGLAIARFESEANVFHPYDSKYDQFLRGQVALTAQEQRGLDWFNRSDKGNCAACHTSAKDADGSHPVFTNYSYHALGVPRNYEYSANLDPNYVDLGLCDHELGPNSVVPAAQPTWCGKFKTPSLRNVSRRLAFFHNGKAKSLFDAVSFHVRRDTHPAEWYPVASDGSVSNFDDLPVIYRANLARSAPFDRTAGQAPALSHAEVDDVLVFLNTLSDGYKP